MTPTTIEEAEEVLDCANGSSGQWIKTMAASIDRLCEKRVAEAVAAEQAKHPDGQRAWMYLTDHDAIVSERDQRHASELQEAVAAEREKRDQVIQLTNDQDAKNRERHAKELQEAVAAERERRNQPQGTMQCPVCGVCSPHSHGIEAIREHVSGYVARWGYKAIVYSHSDPRNKEVRDTLEWMKQEKANWEANPRGFSTVSYHECPMLERAIEAIELQNSELANERERHAAELAKTLRQHNLAQEQAIEDRVREARAAAFKEAASVAYDLLGNESATGDRIRQLAAEKPAELEADQPQWKRVGKAILEPEHYFCSSCQRSHGADECCPGCCCEAHDPPARVREPFRWEVSL